MEAEVIIIQLLCQKMKLLEEVYKELDADARSFVDSYIGKNVTVVSEGNLRYYEVYIKSCRKKNTMRCNKKEIHSVL